MQRGGLGRMGGGNSLPGCWGWGCGKGKWCQLTAVQGSSLCPCITHLVSPACGIQGDSNPVIPAANPLGPLGHTEL